MLLLAGAWREIHGWLALGHAASLRATGRIWPGLRSATPIERIFPPIHTAIAISGHEGEFLGSVPSLTPFAAAPSAGRRPVPRPLAAVARGTLLANCFTIKAIGGTRGWAAGRKQWRAAWLTRRITASRGGVC
jgi:hypothetical protein